MIILRMKKVLIADFTILTLIGENRLLKIENKTHATRLGVNIINGTSKDELIETINRIYHLNI